jgi:hypothetical protein
MVGYSWETDQPADHSQPDALPKTELAWLFNKSRLGYACLHRAVRVVRVRKNTSLSLSLWNPWLERGKRKREDAYSYPHRAILSQEPGLLSRIAHRMGSTDVDEPSWPARRLSRELRNGADGCHCIIAIDLDCLIPSHCLQFRGCHCNGPSNTRQSEKTETKATPVTRGAYHTHASASATSSLTFSGQWSKSLQTICLSFASLGRLSEVCLPRATIELTSG